MQSCDVWLYGSSNVTKIGLDLSVKPIELGVGNWNGSTHAKARQSSSRTDHTGKKWVSWVTCVWTPQGREIAGGSRGERETQLK